VLDVSLIRIGLAETKHFSEGYEAIFGSKKKKDGEESAAKPKTQPKAKKVAKAGKKKAKK